jgi:folate-binding Fe-S cluster repair protein YgfZ
MTKKMTDKMRSEALVAQLKIMVVEVNNTSKTSDILTIFQKRIAQALSLMTVETNDELEIARLWLAFEGEIIKMRGLALPDDVQPALTYVVKGKGNGKKQG